MRMKRKFNGFPFCAKAAGAARVAARNSRRFHCIGISYHDGLIPFSSRIHWIVILLALACAAFAANPSDEVCDVAFPMTPT